MIISCCSPYLIDLDLIEAEICTFIPIMVSADPLERSCSIVKNAQGCATSNQAYLFQNLSKYISPSKKCAGANIARFTTEGIGLATRLLEMFHTH